MLIRLTVFTLLLTAACAARTEPPPAEHTHEHTAPMPDLPATVGPGFTVADVRFMQNMIGHHAQAIRMAEMAPTREASPKVRQMAQKVDISQRDEIAMMKQWLTARKQPIPDDTHAHAMMMPGMLSPQQLDELAAARGHDFDRLFLTYMIRHHQGALKMVEELFSSHGAGQDSDIFRFATDVDADQRDEIFLMERLLSEIGEESK
jgi:uncharacterized protein (DUF305 family)